MFGLIMFYGMSYLVGYVTPNPVYSYILYV